MNTKTKIILAAIVVLLVGGAAIFYSDSSLLTGSLKKKKYGSRQAQDATRPTLELISPASNTTVSGIQEISVTANDNVGVTRVDFFVDDYLIWSDNAAPYAYSWDTAGADDGIHDIRVHAYDAARNSTSVRDIVTVTHEANEAPAGVEPGDRLPSSGILSNSNVPLFGFYLSSAQDGYRGYVNLEYNESATPDLDVSALALYRDGALLAVGAYEMRDAQRTQDYRIRTAVENATVPILIDFHNSPISGGAREYYEIRAYRISNIDEISRQCVTFSLRDSAGSARTLCNQAPALQIGPESRDMRTAYAPPDEELNFLLYDFAAYAPENTDARFRRVVLRVNKTAGVTMGNIRILSGPQAFSYNATDMGDSIVIELDEAHTIPAGENRVYEVWVVAEGSDGDSVSVELENRPDSRRTYVWREESKK